MMQTSTLHASSLTAVVSLWEHSLRGLHAAIRARLLTAASPHHGWPAAVARRFYYDEDTRELFFNPNSTDAGPTGEEAWVATQARARSAVAAVPLGHGRPPTRPAP